MKGLAAPRAAGVQDGDVSAEQAQLFEAGTQTVEVMEVTPHNADNPVAQSMQLMLAFLFPQEFITVVAESSIGCRPIFHGPVELDDEALICDKSVNAGNEYPVFVEDFDLLFEVADSEHTQLSHTHALAIGLSKSVGQAQRPAHTRTASTVGVSFSDFVGLG